MTDLWTGPSFNSCDAQRALAAAVRQTLAVTHALLAAGRSVDLTGLEHDVGLLCAKTLDLPPDAGRAARPDLALLLLEVEHVTSMLRAAAPP